jgi:hypothetical protein
VLGLFRFRRIHPVACESLLCGNAQKRSAGRHMICKSISDRLDAMQTNNVPHFDYHLENPLSMRFGCIEMDGKIIHKIDDINEFYHEFGYSRDMMKNGILPEEYIWSRYVHNATCNFVICLQIRIIKYLLTHSEKYCEQCRDWLDAYLNETVAKAGVCSDCRMKLVCEKMKISK